MTIRLPAALLAASFLAATPTASALAQSLDTQADDAPVLGEGQQVADVNAPAGLVEPRLAPLMRQPHRPPLHQTGR